MPRYFFDVADGQLTPDVTGTELAGLEQARLEAVLLSGTLLKDNPARFWQGGDWHVEVKDDRGSVLFTLMFKVVEAPSIRGLGLPRGPSGASARASA